MTFPSALADHLSSSRHSLKIDLVGSSARADLESEVCVGREYAGYQPLARIAAKTHCGTLGRLWSFPKYLEKSSVFCFGPRCGHVSVALKGVVDITDSVIADHFVGTHLCQQLKTMPDRDIEILRHQMHPDIVGNHYCGANLPKGQDKAIYGRWWRAILAVSSDVGKDCSADDALGRCNRLLLACTKAHLRRKTFSQKVWLIKPRKLETQRAAVTDLILDILEDGNHILLVPKLPSQHRTNALCQTKVSVGIEEDKCQRFSSAQRAVASFNDMSNSC